MIIILSLTLVLYGLHRLSYVHLKRAHLRGRRWALNVCCGKTDGGGINADIVKHDEVPNFRLIDDIYRLPFADGEFESVLCSHTIEHVDDPERLDRELRRVGREVMYVLPPLWDLAAAFNVFEHRWIFLTFRKSHTRLPRYVKLPFSASVHRLVGQRIAA
jgi:ubiquinone/menaquinone biosynthesis C-methylase UbiE